MPVAMNAEGVTYYLGYDQVGSLRIISDSAGNVIKSVEYDSFGNILNDKTLTFTVPFGFAGGLHDRDSGLVKFGYRDYDPFVGRWTAKDPIGFEGGDTNLYGYVQNNPVNFIDPLGLSTVVFDRSDSTITIYPGDGTLHGPPQVFPANNNTIRPNAKPWTPGANGPAPNGTFPVGAGINTGNNPNSSFGTMFFPIIMPPTNDIPRPGLGLHAGRQNKGGPKAKTKGCVRTNEDALSTLRNDPPIRITIQD